MSIFGQGGSGTDGVQGSQGIPRVVNGALSLAGRKLDAIPSEVSQALDLTPLADRRAFTQGRLITGLSCVGHALRLGKGKPGHAKMCGSNSLAPCCLLASVIALDHPSLYS